MKRLRDTLPPLAERFHRMGNEAIVFSPSSTKNMPSVVMKDGIPKIVVTTPTPAAQASAANRASHSFALSLTNRIAQTARRRPA